MLSHIHIKDLVIVHSLALELAPGMTALTGETGAGKSILIDALGLALGDKTDNSMIREGCDRAEVSAVFELSAQPHILQWLEKHDLASDDECILRRVLIRDGRSRAFINGRPIAQQSLHELGELLVDIHGQHAHQSLLKASAQRQLLDAYAGHEDLLRQVSASFRQYQQASKNYADLLAASTDRANRIDFLRFQITELNQLNLVPGESVELERDYQRLLHAERLQSESAGLSNLLYDADDAVQPILARSVNLLQELSNMDDSLREGVELLTTAQIQVEEAVTLLRDYADSVEVSPARLAEIDERLALLHELARKHRVSIDGLVDQQQGLEGELRDLETADSVLEELANEVNGISANYQKLALALSHSRKKAAARLSKTVTESMQKLGLEGGYFSAEINVDNDRMTIHGMDDIEFTVAANPGQKPGVLTKVASGGELSRISLAIQVATSGCGNIPTLIFDEVDVGIGGAVAEIVGKLLRNLGEKQQVLCVTHLPQVASLGHQHLQVEKSTSNDLAETSIRILDHNARIREVARMLGGIEITDHTLAHANEMIARAQEVSH